MLIYAIQPAHRPPLHERRADSHATKCFDVRSSEIPFVFSEPPQVRIELQQQDVAWGDTVRFSCQVGGKPAPTVVWLHNAQPLNPSPRHRMSPQVLRVLNVGQQDDGVYQCMAENGVGSSQAATRLLTVPTGM